MADTSQQEQQPQEAPEPPQTNGIDGLTEEEKSKMRPADIDADMREMERRKRVEMMMNSRLFREELERIIETQMKDGAGPSGLLQQISEMMGPQGARFNANVFRNSNCVVPINDIRGVESMGYAKGEKLLRCKLAAVFRLLDLYGWTQGVGGMITARLNQDQEHFLVNPYGLLYHEITASSLVKVDMQGTIVEQGTTNFGVHIASYQLHSAIHAARPDIKCIVHIATPSVTAISSTKCGILPLGQESIVIGEVSSHHYIGSGTLDPEERDKLERNFGPINKVMLLTNRGALCCGETIEEAFYNVYNTVLACETQLKLMPLGVDNLNLISDEARKAIYESSRKAPAPQQSSVVEPSPLAEKLEKRWRIGGTEFEALMRMLDNAGFRTGYIYRHPLVKSELPRPRNDVEVPPAVSSLGYLLEEEELYKQGLWKGGRKGTDRTRWLNSPNVYQKVEILETGTPDPKKITKWVSDGSPTHSSTPVKIDGALQFVPKNTNPKEFKQIQQQIKDYRRADKISAGPQSHILEGVTWEEAKKMQDATISGTGEQVVLVGAASKGIIQRGFQHNAMVYKTPYAKNPFDAVTDQELDQYKKEVERKAKGELYDESQSESEALSSFNISRATHESSTAKSPIQSPVSVTSETEEESRDEPKVLRIETKQVPAPSQPEVVLSDERSVEPSVVENPIARREDLKLEQPKAQRGMNIKTVNAEFLNEQRRSEMMTRRNINGRGISGVSRLSSSRSSISTEEFWPWNNYYDACYLATARTQELARPIKALITKIYNASERKRRLKREFFENYENRLKNNLCLRVKDENKCNVDKAASNFEVIRAKFDKDTNRKVDAKKQNKQEREIVITDIHYSKNMKMDFAKIVNLPFESPIRQYDIKNIDKEVTSRVPLFSIKMESNIKHDKDNRFYDTLILKNEIDSGHKFSLIEENENIFDINDNLNSTVYVNEIEFTVYDHINESPDNKLENSPKIVKASNNTNFENKNNEKNILNNDVDKCICSFDKKSNVSNSINECNEEIIHYVNEIEFFVCDNSVCIGNETTEETTLEDPLKLSLDNDAEVIIESSSELFNNDDRDKINSLSNCTNENNILQSSIQNQKLESDFSVEKIEKININSTQDLTSNLLFKNNNPEIKDNEEPKYDSTDDEINTNKNKNLWMSIINDNIGENERNDKYSRVTPNCLEFTFSEIDDNEVFSSASTTKERFFSDDDFVIKRVTRKDSITEIINGFNVDVKSSNKITLDMLANTENSVKYNLDSQNMSLIYSITPPNDIDNSSKNTTIAEDVFEDNSEECNNCSNNHDSEDIIWINLSSNIEKKDDALNMNKTVEFSEESFISNVSEQGSDLLELPPDTYLDLQKSSDELFHKNMSSSVNQILTELNDAEARINAENFVDEIVFDISCLNLPRNFSKDSKIELNAFIQEKIWALKFTKKLVKDLIRNLPCYDVDKSAKLKVSSNEELNRVESLDESVYVIREIIHHVVDKDNLGKLDIKRKNTVTDKKVKESMNIELKGLKDDFDISNEKILKCSTPKILSPARSRCNSFSDEQNVADLNNDNEKLNTVGESETVISKDQQSTDTVGSSNSSPSTNSQNFAEQEVTSESTDNDTKSDSSKEKRIDTCETLKNQLSSSRDQLHYNLNCEAIAKCIDVSKTNCIDQNESSETIASKVSFCIIECINENKSSLSELNVKKDNETDSDNSIEEFMQSFVKHQEDIDQMWELREAKFEEIYTNERLNEIPDVKQDFINNKENIKIEEQATSFACYDEGFDKKKSFLKYDKVDDLHYITHDKTIILENTTNQPLSTIFEEPEKEILENSQLNKFDIESIDDGDSFDTLPPIFEEAELQQSFYSDNLEDVDGDNSKTMEFLSCQNSISVKSCTDQEISNSTLSFSTEENSDVEKIHGIDVSSNNDASSVVSSITYRSDTTTISDKVDGQISNNTENNTDLSSISSLNNNEVFTLECMTYSYDTTEFLKLERACSVSSNDVNNVYRDCS